MPTTPWYTSRDLVAAIQRKIAIPLNQRTFTSDDLLQFAFEEMLISQVPDILMYHQEYFVWSEDVLLVANQQRYPIPERAMGMKLRDIYYVDTNGNLFEMTRINPDDKAYWQRESAVINLMQKYYLEGNDIVLAPQNVQSPTGTLRFSYFIRPNLLVDNSRAAIVSSFFTNLTIHNSLFAPGDTLRIANLTFTAVSGAPSALQFQIGGNDLSTSTNLANAINLDGTYSASVTNPNIVSVFYTQLTQLYQLSTQQIINDIENDDDFATVEQIQTNFIPSNPNAIVVSNQIGLVVPAGVPSNITPGILTDFLQTRSGHRLYAKDITVQSVSTTTLLFNQNNVPLNFVVGDYVCNQYESIIPQIPTDLHNGLAERVCARILAAQGDMQGLQISQSKLGDIKHSEGILTENRVDGSTEKVNQRKSPLSFMRMGIRRRI